jgi:amidase
LGFRTSYGLVPADDRDLWLPSMGVIGPMARNVADLAMLLAIQVGYDDRVPLSMAGDGAIFRESLERDFRGKRIAWVGDFQGYLPFENGVLEVCEEALKTFETLGCTVEKAQPDYPVDSVWRAWVKLRAWQSGASLLMYYNDPTTRALLKPEAIFEVESAHKLTALDIAAASAVRTEWYEAVRRFFKTYDYFIVPTAQVFPFDVDSHWPREIADQKMETYHEWMKGVVLITMSGCPALAVPAGFSNQGLSIGIQIVGPNRAELSCLQLAYGYDMANRSTKRLPTLLKQLPVQPASLGPSNESLGRDDDSNAVLRNPAGPSGSI